MLSIADCLLATLWVVGGIIYLSKMSQHKAVCLFVSLLTVVRDNLTCTVIVCISGLAVDQNVVYALYVCILHHIVGHCCIHVHCMHGRMHFNYDLATTLLANDPLSSLA